MLEIKMRIGIYGPEQSVSTFRATYIGRKRNIRRIY